MISKISGLAVLAVVLISLTTVSAWGHDSDEKEHRRVLLSDVKTLTLYHDKKTTHRRSSAVPQLKCNSGHSLCSQFAPHVVQCYNKGSDGLDAQWECTAQLDSQVKFDVLKVSCEGFDSANDPYVLAGSCGLEYTFAKTGVKPSGKSSHTDSKSSSGLFGGLMKFIFSAFAITVGFIIASALAIYHFCFKKNSPRVHVCTNEHTIHTEADRKLYPNLPPSYEHATSREDQGWGEYIMENLGGNRVVHMFKND